MESHVEYEQRVKRFTRPVVPGEMTAGLAVALGYAFPHTVANALAVDNERCFTVGRWFLLQRILNDFRPAVSMLAEEGFHVSRLDGSIVGPIMDPERRLLVETARMIQALDESRRPESSGGVAVTTEELRGIAILGSNIIGLINDVINPKRHNAKYSMVGVDFDLAERAMR